MHTVADILLSKSKHTVYHIAPTALVLDALKLMAENNIGALLVMESEQIVGIISERDYARKVELRCHRASTMLVRYIMTPSVICVGLGHTAEQCMGLMAENKLLHLPVVEQGKVIGLISILDLVEDIISCKKFTIGDLNHYVHGVRS